VSLYSQCFKERPFSKLVTYIPQGSRAVFHIIVMKINMDSHSERKPKKFRGEREHLLRTDTLFKSSIQLQPYRSNSDFHFICNHNISLKQKFKK